MKRTSAIWSLFFLQAAPILVIIVAASGLLEPFVAFTFRSIPHPDPGERPGIFLGMARFGTEYWLLGCIFAIWAGTLAAIVFVAFNREQTRLQRFIWTVAFVAGQSVAVILYCVLRLLPRAGAGHESAA